MFCLRILLLTYAQWEYPAGFVRQQFEIIVFVDGGSESHPVIVDKESFLRYPEDNPWKSNILKWVKVGFQNANENDWRKWIPLIER